MLASLSYIIPTQKTGNHSAATANKTMECRPAASVLFNKAKHRLLNINGWGELCCGSGAKFQLTDKNGIELNIAEPETGHLIRIKAPTPNTGALEYDWLRIEKFESYKDPLKDEELFGFIVRPIPEPFNRTGNEQVYLNDTTSTFLILRKSLTVYVMEHGRNEEPKAAGSFFNKIKHFAASLASTLGLTKTQWTNLVKGILNH